MKNLAGVMTIAGFDVSDRMLVVKETYLEIFLEMVFDDLLSV